MQIKLENSTSLVSSLMETSFDEHYHSGIQNTLCQLYAPTEKVDHIIDIF